MTSCKRPWPVLVVCCFLGFNASGMTLGLGAIFTDVMDTFGVSRTTAALVQSLNTGFMCVGGIFSGHFLQSRGPRMAVITGSVLATVGCVIAFLATHIVQVIVGIGVITGSGFALNFVTHLTLPGILFHDIRSLALSLNATMSAIGTVVYPLLLRHVTNHYSVRGTFLIMAAINCQLILFGALIGLYTPRKKLDATAGKTAEHKMETVKHVYTVSDNVEQEIVKPVVRDTEEGVHPHGKDKRNRSKFVVQNQVHPVVDTKDEAVMECVESLKVSPRWLKKSDGLTCTDEALQEETNCQMPAGRQENESNPDSSLEKKYAATAEKCVDDSKPNRESQLKKSDMKCHGHDARKTTPHSCCSIHTIRKAMSTSLELFRDPRFFAMSVFGGSNSLLFPLPWMFMTDMIKSNNLSVEDGSLLITVLFVGSLTGRVSGGFLYKLLKSWIQIIPGVATIMGGISCLLLVFCKSFAHFVVVSLFHGLGFGLLTTTTSMASLEIVGPGRFAVATGYGSFCVGVFFLLSGPYGGLIRDLTNSYELLYHIAVVHGLVIGTVMLFTILRYHRRS